MEFQKIKITNPQWLKFISKEIEAFVNKVNIKTVTPQSQWTAFAESISRAAVQKLTIGVEMEEFWAVLSGDLSMSDPDNAPKCHAFAHWMKLGVPHIGTVLCDALYSWNRQSEPAQLLYQEFIDFGKKLRCPYYQIECRDEALARLFEKNGKKLGIDTVERTGRIQLIGR